VTDHREQEPMKIRIDPEKLRGILAVSTRESKEKPSISGLLYRVPNLLWGKAAARPVVEFLMGFPAFQGLTRKEVSQLAFSMHERSFGDGEIIFDQGNPSAALYLVREGCVELFRSTNGTEATVIALGPNEHFGEMALLLDEAPRQVSARSRGPSELLALTRPDFETLMQRSPVAGTKLLRALARVVAMRFKMILEAVEGGTAE
jgi:CRP/FNR family transcriptional regulator, cyclic AMP receptor protein